MPHKKKPGIAVIISIGKKPKPDMKKYVGDAMPNAMNKAWKVLKIQDWRADNQQKPLGNQIPPEILWEMERQAKKRQSIIQHRQEQMGVPTPDPVTETGMRTDNSRQTSLSEFDPNLGESKFSEYPRQSPFKNRSSDYPPQLPPRLQRPQRTDFQQGNNRPLLPPQPQNPKPPSRAFDPEQYGPAYPMAKVNPNVPKQFQQGNQSPNQPLPPPNTDPSWTPEAIARINAQNDEARRALQDGQP